MIWIDVATPKYAMFFAGMIRELEKRGFEVLVTTRYAPNYTEAKEILELHQIPHIVLGEYGGATLLEKFEARIFRQKEILDLFKARGVPKVLICGAVVDSVQVAYGIGIPVVNIYDTPAFTKPKDSECPKELTAVARLTLPFSKIFFYPFIFPKELMLRFALDENQIQSYPFIDVALWINAIQKDSKNDFRTRYGLDTQKPTILIREEEYKAHYVKEQIPTIYEVIPLLKKEMDVNLVIMPRYEKERLKKDFGEIATILEEKLKPEEFYPFIDLFIGGGGTMNLESVCYGIPTISTRSIWLVHDQYLIKNKLMFWSQDCNEIVQIAKSMLGKRIDSQSYFVRGECSFDSMIERITKEILC
ncbi:DUF354 domain-containing protein [Helicobacter canadensis]|uniref:DUF354 domain-containing protein n=1 Tax=Helicobacter canadensis MIT 98-5491 TaxID=537970 RepID=C5ZZC0_9HELI|nr:DUF354 domain-containing protein [Helicobacter canadensis]EES89378.1 conserved hypothetical protein [Helicobacter canadensis MIT 98-5491]EFR48167.1 hypothetical protein HCMG_00340 [Helicobacter canadensis MIT 98-5491]STO99413.1 Uncharacterized protein conserved in archaea [Helicobacter canadensis]